MVDKSDRTHTFNGAEITSGLRVFNYYDRKWGQVPRRSSSGREACLPVASCSTAGTTSGTTTARPRC
ncbi:hypothetical protein [Streptomyces sp. NPDC093149]|uniref:hypothetical protein n=1 Tax=Streptomyces sp. NPDC093149 TaxID=3366031 RepID=UPI0037FC4894